LSNHNKQAAKAITGNWQPGVCYILVFQKINLTDVLIVDL